MSAIDMLINERWRVCCRRQKRTSQSIPDVVPTRLMHYAKQIRAVDTRPPSAREIHKEKVDVNESKKVRIAFQKICIAGIAPLNIRSLAVNSVFMPDG